MTEQIRVRDLIEYLKQQDPDAKVTAGGRPMLWERPVRTDDRGFVAIDFAVDLQGKSSREPSATRYK